MSIDPKTNPYAPPAAVEVEREVEDAPRRGKRAVDFEPERRPVIVVLLLYVVTFGAYAWIWLWRRRSFIDALDTIHRDKLLRLPEAIAFLWVASIVASLFGKDAATIGRTLSLVAGICSLIATFTVARALRSEIARTGRFLELSNVLVFFFGVPYLQYKMNQIADTPARRRKKRKKKIAGEPEQGEAASEGGEDKESN